MSDQQTPRVSAAARSFGKVAQAYDRARPSYPPEIVDWLVGPPSGDPKRVLELGAGTGKLTELLTASRHHVIATDPSPEMLGYLKVRAPRAEASVAVAEHLPVPSRSIDVVVCAESFHWFDHDRALDEIARVLRPGGTLALVWNFRDEGIPWVRKLGAIIGAELREDLVAPARECPWFGVLEESEHRFWQQLGRDDLFDLVRSRSYVATLAEHEREAVLERVGALYDDYGRGPDGMKLPYLTRCYRTTVVEQPPAPVVVTPVADPDATQAVAGLPTGTPAESGPAEDPGTLLIDFR